MPDRLELLERTRELDELTATIKAADAGQGATVLVTGEAGIGKSALLATAGTIAAASGMTVLTARGGEWERDFPWGITRQLFESVVARADELDLLRGAAGLARTALVADAPTDVEDASFATLHGLYWLVANLAHEQHLVVVVDDVHWADVPSMRFLAHLLPRIDELPVAVLLASRPPIGESGPAADFVTSLIISPSVKTVSPDPLTEAAAATMVRSTMDRDVADDFARACHEVSGGNPFLLKALVGELVQEEVEADHAGAARVRRITPAAVSASVLLRLARLPPETRDLARAVAVLGSGVDVHLAAALAGLDVDGGAHAAGALIRAGVLADDRELSFVHPLVGSAVHGDLSRPERSRWHERAARLLAREDAPVEHVASHLAESLPNRDQSTVECLRAAAANATARGAPEIALDWLRRALDEPPSDATRAEVLFELGEVIARQDPSAAVSPLQEALAVAQDARLRSSIALALGDALTTSGRLGDAVHVLTAGLEVAEQDPASDALRAPLFAALLGAARWDADAQDLRRRLVDDLRRDMTRDASLDPLLRCQLAIEESARGVDLAAAIEHARGTFENPGVESRRSAAMFPEAALVLVFADEADEARQRIETWLGIAQRQGWATAVSMASTCASLAALYRGEFDEAIAHARGAVVGSADIRLNPVTVAFLVEALIEHDDLDLAARELEESGLGGELPLAWATTPVLLARGRRRAAAGDHQQAVVDLFAVRDRCLRWGVDNPAMVPWRWNAALSLAHTGDRDHALVLVDEAIAVAERWGAPRSVGCALRAAGVVRGGRDGIELLEAAVGTLESSPAVAEHARAITDLGAALRRVGHRTDARRHLSAGLDLAHRLGAHAIARRAREELIIAGARPRRAALRGRDALTPSELRVAQLAAEGRTNKEIAEALFLTLRTVETHLTNSYSKLFITSRRQLREALGPDDR